MRTLLSKRAIDYDVFFEEMNLDYKTQNLNNHKFSFHLNLFKNKKEFNPFNDQQVIYQKSKVSDEIYEDLLSQSKQAFEEFCSENISFKNINILHEYVKTDRFILQQNTQFFDPSFASSIHLCLLPGVMDDICEEAILILSNIYIEHPDIETPIINELIISKLIDILNSHIHQEFRFFAMQALLNYCMIGNNPKQYLLKNDIFTHIRNYLICCDSGMQFEAGLRMLYQLCKDGVDYTAYQLLQIIPVYNILLRTSNPINRIQALWTLSIMIENEQLFNFCKIVGIHSLLAECSTNLYNQRYAFYLYICILRFVEDHYYRVFYNESMFSFIQYILYQNENENLSPMFFTIALLIDKFCSELYDDQIIKRYIFYAKEGIFDNKVSSCFCIAKFLLNLSSSQCQMIALNDGLDVICNIIEATTNSNIVLIFLKAVERLLDINSIVFGSILMNYKFSETLNDIYDKCSNGIDFCNEDRVQNDELEKEILICGRMIANIQNNYSNS